MKKNKQKLLNYNFHMLKFRVSVRDSHHYLGHLKLVNWATKRTMLTGFNPHCVFIWV